MNLRFEFTVSQPHRHTVGDQKKMKTMKTNDSNIDKLCFDMLPCHVGNKKKAFRQIRSREWQRDSSSIVSKFKHFSQIRLRRINRFVYLFWTQPKFVDIADNLFQWISLKWLVRTKHTKIIESSSMPFSTESEISTANFHMDILDIIRGENYSMPRIY